MFLDTSLFPTEPRIPCIPPYFLPSDAVSVLLGFPLPNGIGFLNTPSILRKALAPFDPSSIWPFNNASRQRYPPFARSSSASAHLYQKVFFQDGHLFLFLRCASRPSHSPTCCGRASCRVTFRLKTRSVMVVSLSLRAFSTPSHPQTGLCAFPV